MITQPIRSIVVLCTMLIAGMPTCFDAGTLQAEEKPPAKKRPNSTRLEQRIERLEKQLQQLHGDTKPTDAEPKKSEPSTNGRRFQMMRVDDRLVILDSDTGETRIIESNSSRPIQNVEVGKALVVVTVLGRVMPLIPSPAASQPEQPQRKAFQGQPAVGAIEP